MTIQAIQLMREVDSGLEPHKRVRHEEAKREAAKDSLNISSGALQAAQASELARRPSGAEIRIEQVEAAKQRIQDGSYKLTEVVLEVAGRIAAHL